MIEANSSYPVYVYNSFKALLVILPSVRTLAKLINSNHSTIVNFIKTSTLFRGEWYFSNLPFNLTDTPLISDWSSKEFSNLKEEILNNSHIKKAIFVYNKNREFMKKFEGVTHAQKDLNINHDIIKKYALSGAPYKGISLVMKDYYNFLNFCKWSCTCKCFTWYCLPRYLLRSCSFPLCFKYGCCICLI